MKRILVVEDGVESWGPCHDARWVADWLGRQGTQVVCLVLRSPSNASPLRTPTEHEVRDVFWPNRFSWSSWQEIRQHIRYLQPEEIHVWGMRAGTLAKVLATLVRCPVKQFVTSTAANRPRTGWRGRRWFSQITPVIRHEQLGDPWKHSGSSRSECEVLPWFQYSRPDRAATREEVRNQLGIPLESRLAGTVAPLVPGARIKDFLWAGDLLRCVRDDVYWLVIGDGPHGWRLQRYASQLDMAGRIRFLGNPARAMDVLGALDIYVQPSDWLDDYCGLRAAVSFGIPAVGVSQSIHQALISHHRTGYLVERGARNEIARCVNRLISEPAIAKQMSETIQSANNPCRLASIEQAMDAWRVTGSSMTPAGRAA